MSEKLVLDENYRLTPRWKFWAVGFATAAFCLGIASYPLFALRMDPPAPKPAAPRVELGSAIVPAGVELPVAAAAGCGNGSVIVDWSACAPKKHRQAPRVELAQAAR